MKKLVLKSLSYRSVSLLVTTSLAWFATGSLSAALAVGGLDSLVKLGLFAGHEVLWENLFGEIA